MNSDESSEEPEEFVVEQPRGYLNSWLASYLQFGKALTPQERESITEGMLARYQIMWNGLEEEQRQSVSSPAEVSQKISGVTFKGSKGKLAEQNFRPPHTQMNKPKRSTTTSKLVQVIPAPKRLKGSRQRRLCLQGIVDPAPPYWVQLPGQDYETDVTWSELANRPRYRKIPEQ